MSADATLRHVREVSFARLAAARADSATLTRERDPRLVRAALIRIARSAKRTIDEADGPGGPSLMSHARMQLAAALLDLASLEPDPERRAKMVAAGARECDTAIRVSLASKAPFLSLKIVPWAMVVLAGALRAGGGGRSTQLRRLMASCVKALPVLDASAKRHGREAARALFRAQLLAVAAEPVTDPVDRAVVQRRAIAMARDARRRALGAGAFAVGQQARRTIAELETQARSSR